VEEADRGGPIVADDPRTAARTSADDEPLGAFTDDESAHPNRPLQIAVGVVVLALLLAGGVIWWRQRPADPKQAARDAAAACDAFDATRADGTTIADFDHALNLSREAVRLDPMWSTLDSSLFSAIDALVYLNKVPTQRTKAQEYAAQTMSAQYYTATSQLAEQCSLAHADS
jgi:hypothetical protein